MARSKVQSFLARPLSRCRSGSSRVASFCVTIRGRILIAFLIMSMITVALGAYATWSIRDAGILVNKTYDESLMSINYARAAATDFFAMRAAFARRWIASDLATRETLDNDIKRLGKNSGRIRHCAASFPVGSRLGSRHPSARRGHCLGGDQPTAGRCFGQGHRLEPTGPLCQQGRRADRPW